MSTVTNQTRGSVMCCTVITVYHMWYNENEITSYYNFVIINNKHVESKHSSLVSL